MIEKLASLAPLSLIDNYEMDPSEIKDFRGSIFFENGPVGTFVQDPGMGPGFEPEASSVQTRRSTRLSYGPIVNMKGRI